MLVAVGDAVGDAVGIGDAVGDAVGEAVGRGVAGGTVRSAIGEGLATASPVASVATVSSTPIVGNAAYAPVRDETPPPVARPVT